MHIVFEVPQLDEGVVDPEGFTYKVALFPSMFSDGFLLPFCLLVCDVQDMTGVAPTQLLSNAWRLLVGCCMIWWRVLEEVRDAWLDLIGQEFFLTHRVLKKRGNTCSFTPAQPLIRLEQQYDRRTLWFRQFFFVSSIEWEYPPGQLKGQNFPIRAN